MFPCKGNLHYHRTWLMIYIEKGICEYYSHLLHMYCRRIDLNPPMHGAHISVIAGKYEIIDDAHKHLWNKYQDTQIDFQYRQEVENDGEYFWLPVKCERIEDIREELGLPRKSPIPWHLTIGNLK